MDFKDYGTFVSNFKSIKNFSEEEIISKSYLYRPTCGVYFLIREDKIVYVGQSIDVFSRIYTHFRENVKEFDNFYFIGCNREDIDLYETFYIQKFQPTYNCIDSTLPSFKTLQQLRIRWNKIYGIDYRDIVNIDALNKITTLYDKYYFLPEVEKLCEPSLKGDLYVLDNLSRKEKIKIWRLKFINHLSVTEIGTELNIDVAILGKFLAILKYNIVLYKDEMEQRILKWFFVDEHPIEEITKAEVVSDYGVIRLITNYSKIFDISSDKIGI